MNPQTKFAAFLTLAGVLAVLFTLLPGGRSFCVPIEIAPDMLPKATHIPDNIRDSARPEVVPSRPTDGGELSRPSADPRVKVPAIRGASHYGWVQLPYGTRVELVRNDGANLWVRWDGIVSRVSAQAARNGAVVLVGKSASRSRKG